MKTSSILNAAVASAFMLVAASVSAAPVQIYGMTAAVTSQKLTVTTCPAVKTTGVSDIQFFDDGTFKLQRDDFNTDPAHSVPELLGTWNEVVGKSSKTIYMSIRNASIGPDGIPAVQVGSIGQLLDAMQWYAQASCGTKYDGAAAATLSFNQPSILVTKSIMTVKNKTSAAKLTLTLKGKNLNNFTGKVKSGSVSSTSTTNGTLIACDPTALPACVPAAPAQIFNM